MITIGTWFRTARTDYAGRVARGAGYGPDPPEPFDLEPPSAYEAVTRQMVEHLAEDLREIKGRLDGLLWMVGGAVIIEFALRLIGAA